MKKRDTTSDGAHIRQAQRVACTTCSRTASRKMASKGKAHMGAEMAKSLSLNAVGEPGSAVGVDVEPGFASRHDASAIWVDGRTPPNPWQARVGGAVCVTCKSISGQKWHQSEPRPPTRGRLGPMHGGGQRGQNTKSTSD